jgi:hypothetical protein
MWVPRKKCGYDVPGIILLRDLKVAMRLNRAKGISVHVSTFTIYYLNVLVLDVCKLLR